MSVTKRDYYEILGVEPGLRRPGAEERLPQAGAASFIRTRNPGDHAAEEKFKEAAEAYSVLSDPQKRAAYDRFGHQGVAAAAPADSTAPGSPI